MACLIGISMSRQVELRNNSGVYFLVIETHFIISRAMKDAVLQAILKHSLLTS